MLRKQVNVNAKPQNDSNPGDGQSNPSDYS